MENSFHIGASDLSSLLLFKDSEKESIVSNIIHRKLFNLPTGKMFENMAKGVISELIIKRHFINIFPTFTDVPQNKFRSKNCSTEFKIYDEISAHLKAQIDVFFIGEDKKRNIIEIKGTSKSFNNDKQNKLKFYLQMVLQKKLAKADNVYLLEANGLTDKAEDIINLKLYKFNETLYDTIYGILKSMANAFFNTMVYYSEYRLSTIDKHKHHYNFNNILNELSNNTIYYTSNIKKVQFDRTAIKEDLFFKIMEIEVKSEEFWRFGCV